MTTQHAPSTSPLGPLVDISIETTFAEDGAPQPVLIGWINLGQLRGQLDRLTLWAHDLSDPEKVGAVVHECREFTASLQAQATAAGVPFDALDLEPELQAWRAEWASEVEAGLA